MTKAFSYLRISSPGAVDLDGFVRQGETIARYAQEHNIEIVQEFREEGVPGKTELDNRPALGRLMTALESNGVRLVLVETADRLARDQVISELIIREFQKISVRLISASGGVDLTAGDPTNPTAKLVRQILAAVAEFDHDIIILKMKAARERIKAKDGKCEGRKAYGTKPGEASTLGLICDYYANGLGPELIARILNRQGIKTRYGKDWNSGTVSRIVERNRNRMSEKNLA